MGILNGALNQFGYIKMNQEATPTGTIEKQFGVGPAASRKMRNSRALWWAMYTNHPPWETDCVRDQLSTILILSRPADWEALRE